MKLNMDTGFLKRKEDLKYFNFPLTVKSEVPIGWTSARVTQSNKVYYPVVVEEGKTIFIMTQCLTVVI